jgi:two-component system, LuxR family, response regulator TtrR
MSRSIQVYIVDDDDAVRGSICWLLESNDHPATGLASGQDLLDLLPLEGQACIVTDVRMPAMTGIELMEALIARGSNIPVVVITAHGDIQMAVEAMKLGALDFVEKPFEEKALVQAVERALDESRRRLETLSVDADVRRRFQQLTTREREVLEMILAGRPNRGVAKDLAISEKTVEAHRAHIMEKTGATSFAELVTKAVQTQFLKTWRSRTSSED